MPLSLVLLVELDAKGPVIYQLKVDYDSSQQTIRDLQNQLTAALTECNGLRLELDDALEQVAAKDRDCKQHKLAARDLRQQVPAFVGGRKVEHTSVH